MKYVSANPGSVNKPGRLLYYIIIDGKSNVSVTFSYHREPPDIWIRLQKKIAYFAVIYRGVTFTIYDNEPFTEKIAVYGVMDQVIELEGLEGEL